MLELIHAKTPSDYEAARKLFLEYAESLGFSLCFQGFEKELEKIESLYSPPVGDMILARNSEGEFVGCVGVKRFNDEDCEMKRLYLMSKGRGMGAGSGLVRESIHSARSLGYKRMLLDTIRDRMQIAIALYIKHDFKEIPPYYPNPLEGVMYMEKWL